MAAPRGNQNAIKAKRWQQAIDRALEKRSKAAGIAELDRLAEVFLNAVEEMIAGTEKRGPDIGGFKELADRLDGKADQTYTVNHAAEELPDDELQRIAAGGSEGVAQAPSGAPEPGQLH